MKFKLESGKEVQLKELTVDETDQLLDSIQYEDAKDGGVKIMMMHSTMTRFLRLGLKNCDDKFIKSLTFQEKSEIFQKIQSEIMNLGEEEASD
tara:strand:+ start:116 stop:394 length:279 start_codon:yes stop_codon:yes gene_type:complete